MSFTIRKIFQPDYAALILLAIAVGSLIFVFVAEYGFDLKPCYLCQWQRVPYYITLVLLVPLIGLKFLTAHQRIVLSLVGVAMLSGAALAVFHSGVERHWWAATEECTLQPLSAAGNLREQLLQTPVARCDQISWTFLGLSMTNWNTLLSLALVAYIVQVLRLWPRKLSNAQN